MGLKRQMERQKKAVTKNELEKAYNKGFRAGMVQGLTNAEAYIDEKMQKLTEVKGVGESLAERILIHLGYENAEE